MLEKSYIMKIIKDNIKFNIEVNKPIYLASFLKKSVVIINIPIIGINNNEYKIIHKYILLF
jgi:hypothetical protein